VVSDNFAKSAALTLDRSESDWPRTINVIPAGVQTFSKMPLQHVDGVAPKYIARSKGSKAWDVDGNEYIDFMSGLGPVILGHADEVVNRAVFSAMENGMSPSLPSPLETELSEKLVELIPCAEMVRFGKNGSDVTSAAIRAARALTGRDKIAICGYHGWQDWYIGTTPRNKGVPKAVQELSLKFNYNEIESLNKLLAEHDGEIAAVILEPVNFFEPENEFLEKVRDAAHAAGALLIFDEIITGFRIGMGGAQKYYGVTPDLACFGKAMANGFPISAVVGKREYMKVFEDIFFSFTFGGETASIAAALTTIDAMEQRGTIEHIRAMGIRLMSGYSAIVDKLGCGEMTRMIGFPWWPEYLFFDIDGSPSREIQSLFQQEIVRRGVLTRAGMMISGAHQKADIDKTLHVFEEALTVVFEAVRNGMVLDLLDGEVIQPVIRKVD